MPTTLSTAGVLITAALIVIVGLALVTKAKVAIATAALAGGLMSGVTGCGDQIAQAVGSAAQVTTTAVAP